MSHGQAVLAAALATAALAGCGEADPRPLTDTQRMVRTAEELTREAGTLTDEIAAVADDLAAGAPAERAEQRLEDQRSRGEELADRAGDELPDDLPVRDELEGAGERIAAAADQLLDFAESGERVPLITARALIGDGARLRASAAHQLADRPPADLDELLERLRERTPRAQSR